MSLTLAPPIEVNSWAETAFLQVLHSHQDTKERMFPTLSQVSGVAPNGRASRLGWETLPRACLLTVPDASSSISSGLSNRTFVAKVYKLILFNLMSYVVCHRAKEAL